MYKVFITYRRTDGPLRHLIELQFKKYTSISILYDMGLKLKIVSEIEKHIEESSLLLVIHTKDSYNSNKDSTVERITYEPYLHNEVKHANDNDIPVIFFRDKTLTKDTIPDVLRKIKDKLDVVYDAENIEDGLKDLEERVIEELKIQKIQDEKFLYKSVLSNLQVFLNDKTQKNWMLSYITENNLDKLGELIQKIDMQLSGQKIDEQLLEQEKDDLAYLINSGFFYWGVGSTKMWEKLNGDHPATKGEYFMPNWNKTKKYIRGNYNYVSLGVGAGIKDKAILNFLGEVNSDVFYIPIDMSAPMLKLASKVTFYNKIPLNNILPIEADFYDEVKNPEIKELLSDLTPGVNNIYGLLGNTLANSFDDLSKLNIIYDLMNPKDYLLLELSTISGDVKTATKKEYESKEFRKFVLSMLLNSSNLPISELKKEDNINEDYYCVDVERNTDINKDGNIFDRDLCIRGYYKNRGEDIEVMFSDWKTKTLKRNQEILLFISRKYTESGLDHLILKSKFNNKKEDEANKVYISKSMHIYKGRSKTAVNKLGTCLILLQKEWK